MEPWTIVEDAQSTPLQAYRQALDRVESASGNFFDATHGGATLLEFPQILKRDGSSTDYEVVELNASTGDGHRLVTLRLRTGPEVKGRDRKDFTFVFDADDLFVVRSIHYGEPLEDSSRIADSSTTIRTAAPSCARPSRRYRLSIGPSDWTWKNAGSGRSPRPSSPSNRSWPASGRAGPTGSRRSSLDRDLLDWYWLAFVGGGISLAGGSGLALGSRYPDRRARGPNETDVVASVDRAGPHCRCRRTLPMVEPTRWERMSFHHRGRPARRMDAVYRRDALAGFLLRLEVQGQRSRRRILQEPSDWTRSGWGNKT